MTFLWPDALWWLLLLPASVAGYVLMLRRNKGEALHYTRLGMMRAAMGRGQAIRRHIPAALLLVALACMLLALGRPAAVVTLPTQSETVILALDVSQSMRAEDVKPTRLAAAQAAAKAFIRQRPRSARIGIVAFAGSAALVQAPTTKREELHAAIDRLQLDAATAVGSGIVASLKAIFPDQKAKPEPVPPGSYKSAAIILLTDGETNVGHEPLAAARLAAERGVRVFTVGVGTPEGEVNTDGWSMRVSVDEDALKGIADLTHGEYFFAANAPDLRRIYEGLNSRLVLEKSETEITALFAGLAAALTLLAAALSLRWFRRVL
jgi:Ca-activated chloride channel family protein